MKSKSYHLPHLTLLIVFLSSSASSQSDSCTSTPNIAGLPVGPSSKCVAVWPREDFILRFMQTSTLTWSFALSAPDNGGYVALGFSPDGRMKGASAVVGWGSDSKGNPGLKQYLLGGYEPKDVVPDRGNLRLNSSKIVKQSSRLYMTFEVEFVGQPLTRLIFAVGPARFQPLSPDFGLVEHRAVSSVVLQYPSGQFIQQGHSNEKLRRTHGILNAFSWGFIMIIGVLVARHMKANDPLWFYSHLSIQLVGFILGLLGVITGLLLEQRSHEEVGAHKGIGVFILVLGCLQVTAVLLRPNKFSNLRKYWNWFHHYSGRIAISFAIFNVFYGFRLGEDGKGWVGGYGVVVAILFLVGALLEFRGRRM